MRLDIASSEAVKYACKYFHYAKRVPFVQCAFSVFNDKNEWCGVIVYSLGANNHLAGSVGMVQGSVLELVRVALNGKQESTSKALALALSLKKFAPLCRCVVSFADPAQSHVGTIYQATNWIYLGQMKGQYEYIINGKQLHGRSVTATYGTAKGRKSVKVQGKHKYLFAFSGADRRKFEMLKKPYPKRIEHET